MNVLLTCVGRRNYLVDYFREALRGRGNVLAANSYGDTAGMLAADEAFVVPPLTDAGYVDELLAICQDRDVGLMLSLYDPDLRVLAHSRERFARVGTTLAVSSPEVIDMCDDKWRTYIFAKNWGIHTPETYLSLDEFHAALSDGASSFPVVVKPRRGMGSLGVEYPDGLDELQSLYHIVRKRVAAGLLPGARLDGPDADVLIQEKLVGTHYAVDVVNDLSGSYICCFAKRKLEMRSGEADRAITVVDDRLEDLACHISRCLGHIGVLDIDLVDVDGDIHLLEMNPRFGGAYPFAHVAGANLPAAMLAWAAGEVPRPEWLRVRPGVLSVKGMQMLSAGGAVGFDPVAHTAPSAEGGR